MKGECGFTYAQFVAANPGRQNSSFDYLHGLISQGCLDGGGLLQLVECFNPQFIKQSSIICIGSLYSEAKHASLVDKGLGISEIEYWMNLVEVDSIFEGIEQRTKESLINAMVRGWERSLRCTFPQESIRVCRLDSENNQEVALTLQRY